MESSHFNRKIELRCVLLDAMGNSQKKQNREATAGVGQQHLGVLTMVVL